MFSLLAIVPGACSNDADDCHQLKTCGGAPGTGGSSTGGASGSSGSSGTAGEAGTGGGDGGTSGAPTGGTGGTSGASASAGDGGAGGAGGGEPPCDGTKGPSEDVCVVDEEYGVFVSPDGDDDTGDGTRANPFATIGKGVEAAAETNKRIYACADSGTYDESLALVDTVDGMEMFGGFSCDDWRYSETLKSRVASSTPLALRIEGVTSLRIEDFAFEAADATGPGESSVGAFVADSTNVLFRRVRIEAGAGMDGEDGVLVPFMYPEQVELNGNNANGGTGGGARTCDCPGGAETIGGVGGTAPNQGGGGGLPDHPGPGGEGGTFGIAGCVEGVGRNGATGRDGDLASGAATNGTLHASSWLPSPGPDGMSGLPGQGGGGGISTLTAVGGGGGGGGGGCGGCGGAGGPGGRGGGASIALISFESMLVIEDCELTAQDAGDGGDGIEGQAGQMESGFGGVQAVGACPGGAGGLGGNGGAGGGGAGGISVGILWSGDAAPLRTRSMISVGMAGDGGVGGVAGSNDGLDGVAQEVLEAS